MNTEWLDFVVNCDKKIVLKNLVELFEISCLFKKKGIIFRAFWPTVSTMQPPLQCTIQRINKVINFTENC